MSKQGKIILIVALILAVILVTVGVWFYINSKNKKAAETPSSQEGAKVTVTTSNVDQASNLSAEEKSQAQNEKKGFLTVELKEKAVIYVQQVNANETEVIGAKQEFKESFSKIFVPGKYVINALPENTYSQPFLRTIELTSLNETKLIIAFEASPFPYTQPNEEAVPDPNSKGQQAYLKFLADNPIIKFLPYQTERFLIDLPDQKTYIYPVYFYPTKKASDDPLGNKEEIESYKKEVADFIREKGFDPAKLKISYRVR